MDQPLGILRQSAAGTAGVAGTSGASNRLPMEVMQSRRVMLKEYLQRKLNLSLSGGRRDHAEVAASQVCARHAKVRRIGQVESLRPQQCSQPICQRKALLESQII